ncbi:MAG: hypothetical protein ACTSSD_14130 [Candidatus Thorarchaeota archaeon]
MRRAIISIILVLSLLSVASTSVTGPLSSSSSSNLDYSPTDAILISEIINSGSNVPVEQFTERLFSSQVLDISNSYAFPDSHEYNIDLSSYLIDGWTLNEVILETINITAIEEREIIGSRTAPTVSDEFTLYEHSEGVYYDQLVQGFYNMSHDGQIQNISLYYLCDGYDPATQHYAYMDVRSDYTDGSTNMVSSVQLENVGLTPTWANVTESVVLDADTVYYTVMNGTDLIEVFSSYPVIRWFYEDDAGDYLTRRHNTDGPTWGGVRPYEAILNYTYIPWNTTSNSALAYSDPSTVNMMLNGTPVSGNSWSISSGNNITSLNLVSDQSLKLFYNLTLSYSQDISASTVWKSSISGSPIMWNVTTDLTYPAVSNVVSRFMNITNIPLDWNATGLYLGTSPGGSYSEIGSNVTCAALSDGTWTLTSTAPNYVVDISLSDDFDSSPIIGKVANTVDMNISASVSMDGGSANLSVLQTGSLIFSPAEIAASSGSVDFLWDIDGTTLGNGTHSVEVYWLSTSGLEAGYITEEVFVYHSTRLVADETFIEAFTDSTFTIGIDFDEISPARGLDDIPADVTYSFGAAVDAPMSNPSGGRWTQVVDTTGMSNGIHLLTINAEGFALENQSLIITVNLDHQTQALNWSWSNTNNITYLDSTNLTVTYRMLNDTRISGATVNVTFQSQTYDMAWDPLTQTYWIELTGADFTAVPGTFVLNVSAWQSGYDARYNSSITITIGSQTGEVFDVEYSPSNLTISYIESLFISVTYDYNSIPIDSNTVVRVLFNGSTPVNLVFNATSSKWETTLLGNNYLGAWNIIVRATADGYSTRENTTTFLVYEDTPSLASSWSGDAESTDYATNILLEITARDSSGAPINGATLSANVFGSDYPLTFEGAGVYSILIDPQETRGVHVVNVTIAETGYVVTSTFLDLTVRATTEIDVDYLSSEYEQWNLTITVTFTDTFYSSPISDGTVTVTIAGVEYTLTYDSGVYVREIVLDFNPGMYAMAVVANGPFCNQATASPELTIQEKLAVYLSLTTEGDPSLEGQRLEIIATLTYNGTESPVRNGDIQFIVWIYYVNGTVEIRDDPTQYDTTNNDGVASWGFEIPSGNIDIIWIYAEYEGDRINWDTSFTYELSVGTNPLMLVLSFFFFTDIGRMLVASLLILGIVATAYNKRVKPKKRAARASLENQLQMFRDLESLRHFMAVYLDRGTCVFYHPFTDERIQPDLISGFIAAITSVYGEIKGDGVRGTLEEIQYHGLRLNSYSGEFIIGILILEGEMTPLLKERLQFFVELFENQYDQDLTEWNGLIDCFDPEWVVSTLSSTFNYSWLLAHRFGPTQKVGKTDARILDYISAVRDDRSEFHFRDLLAPLAEMLDITEAEVLDRLLVLQDRGVIAPVSIQTILQRQGMGLANGEIGAGTQLELPEKEEPKVDEPELPAEPVKESTPAEEPDKVEELVYDDDSLVEEKEEDKKEELDPMDAFVKDVESLLTKEKEDENEES